MAGTRQHSDKSSRKEAEEENQIRKKEIIRIIRPENNEMLTLLPAGCVVTIRAGGSRNRVPEDCADADGLRVRRGFRPARRLVTGLVDGFPALDADLKPEE